MFGDACKRNILLLFGLQGNCMAGSNPQGGVRGVFLFGGTYWIRGVAGSADHEIAQSTTPGFPTRNLAN